MKNVYSGAVIIGLLGALTACAPQGMKEKSAEVGPVVVQTAERLDDREILPLNQIQRQHVLVEMRGLLAGTQGIIEGLALDDMQMVQNAALAVGMNAMHTVENQKNMKRLRMGQAVPPEFMTLGRGVHRDFDAIAQMAADGKPAKEIQLKLVEVMNACAACHSAYQIPNP